MQPTDATNPEINPEIPENEQPGPEATREDLLAQLDEAQAQRDEYLDMAQRMKAEFENFRRRNAAARSEAYEEGAREMTCAILPVIDNLERALDAAQGETTPLGEGVHLVHKQLLEVLEKHGVTVINRIGEPFDPELEEAVAQADASEGAPGAVATVILKGYRHKDRVIRHAVVRVVADA